MHVAAMTARLIVPSSLLNRVAARLPRTGAGAVELTAVAATANNHLVAATGAQEQTALLRRCGMDGRHGWQDSRPACVPGTVWGKAPTLNLQVARGAVLTPRFDRLLPHRPSGFPLLSPHKQD